MKKPLIRYILVGVITLTLGLLLGRAWFGGSAEADHSHDPAPTAGAEATVWTCSMHPQIRATEPGDCPICGMDLIPAETEASGTAASTVSLSESARQLASVYAAPVQREVPKKVLRLYGKIAVNEQRVSIQSAHVGGRIEQLNVNTTGEPIRQGQVLGYLYAPALVTAQQELIEAYALRESQPDLYAAARTKLSRWRLSPAQLDAIVAEGTPKERFPLVADVNGVVTRKLVNLGDYVQQGAPLYEVADLSQVWALLDVYENDLPWLQVGSEVTVTSPILPGVVLKGAVAFIDPTLDPKTRTAQARVVLPNSTGVLKPDLLIEGRASTQLSDEPVLSVPKSAVLWTGERSVVYVEQSTPGDYELREVTLGPALANDRYAIAEGLAEGDRVVVSGAFTLDAAAQLAGKNSMMMPSQQPGEAAAFQMDQPVIPGSVPEEEVIEPIALSEAARGAVNLLYPPYLQWKNALVADDLAGAKVAAEELKHVVKNVPMKAFGEAAHAAWMEYHEVLQEALTHVAHHEEIEANREAFETVSDVLIHLTRRFGPPASGLYVQHCPMAFDFDGANWLSKEEEILNPYFGDAMLTCGEVTDTLEPR